MSNKRKGAPLYKGMPNFDDPEDQELANLMGGLNMVSKIPRFDNDISDEALHEVLDKVEVAVKQTKKRKKRPQPVEWYYGYRPYHVKRYKGNGNSYYTEEWTDKKEWYQRPRPLDTRQVLKY